MGRRARADVRVSIPDAVSQAGVGLDLSRRSDGSRQTERARQAREPAAIRRSRLSARLRRRDIWWRLSIRSGAPPPARPSPVGAEQPRLPLSTDRGRRMDQPSVAAAADAAHARHARLGRSDRAPHQCQDPVGAHSARRAACGRRRPHVSGVEVARRRAGRPPVSGRGTTGCSGAREEQRVSTYSAPLRDMQFAIEELADLKSIASLAGCEDATPDLVNSVLEEAAKFAGGVWAPLDRVGDVEGARWNDGHVPIPDRLHAAYRQFVEAGWNGLRFGAEYGGQGLPKLVDAAVMEMWNGANLGFSLVSLLTQGAIEAILLRGTEAQKQKYLPRLVTGEWTGTMNLTEPQAGSDLALLRASAVPEGDHYRIRGQKIFISFGEHDLADNIMHLVLARTPNAPAGVKGISLFLVPKFLVNDDGGLGERNDVSCVS